MIFDMRDLADVDLVFYSVGITSMWYKNTCRK